MALFKNGFFEGLFEGGLGTGLAVGLGALVLGPAVLSAVGALMRPVAKAAIKGGLILYGQTRSLIGETSEAAQDLVAERRAEISGTASHAGSPDGEMPPQGAASPETPAAPQEAPGQSKPWIVRGY